MLSLQRTAIASRSRLLRPATLQQLAFLRPQPFSSSSSSFARPSAAPRPPAATTPQQQQHRQNGQAFTDSYHLSDRIKLLASRDQLDAAIQLVKSSPSPVATVVVWNVLLNAVLQAKQFKRAYELWMDMKRRGVEPTARSYGTFFSGFAKLKGEVVEGGNLARVQTVYRQWEHHVEKVLERSEQGMKSKNGKLSILVAEEEQSSATKDTVDDLSVLPTNHYLSFLSSTHNIDLLLSTFSSLPSDGPLSPTSMTYSIVLSGLRQTASTNPAHFTSAMNIWKQLLASPSNLDIDTKTVSIIISLCRDQSRPDDQRAGLEVAKAFYGFVDPTDEALLVASPGNKSGLAAPRVELDSPGLSNVLSLAIRMQQFNLVVRWFDQVRDYPKRFGKGVIDHHQCDLVLVAMAAKRDASGAEDLIDWMYRQHSRSLTPTIATYTAALQVCWKSADLVRAYRLLTLMTGQPIGPEATAALPPSPSSSTADEAATTAPPTVAAGDAHKPLEPDDRILSTLLQTALATRDRGSIYRCLEILDSSFNITPLSHSSASTTPLSLAPSSSTTSTSPSSKPQREKKDPHAAYWLYTLSSVLSRALERVLQGGEGHLTPQRRRELAIWRGDVLRWLEVRDEESLRKRAGVKEGETGETMESRRRGLRKERVGGERETVGKEKRRGGARSWDGRGYDEGMDRSEERRPAKFVSGSQGRDARRWQEDEVNEAEEDFRIRVPPSRRTSYDNDRGYDRRGAPPSRERFSRYDNDDRRSSPPRWNSYGHGRDDDRQRPAPSRRWNDGPRSDGDRNDGGRSRREWQ